MRKLAYPLLFTLPLASLAACQDDSAPPDVVVDPPEPAQAVVHSDKRPPAISGGTLLVTRDSKRAVAADPDRDRVLITDLDSEEVQPIALSDGDEPGRVVEDSAGRVHVALRGGGAVVTLSPQNGQVLARRDVCAAPRGMAASHTVDGGAESIVIACASGELVELAASPSGGVLERHYVEGDLRDVVVTGDGTKAGRKLLVSSFRSAEVLTLNASFQLEHRAQPNAYEHPVSQRKYAPTVAWRMVAADDGAMMIHQRSATVPIGEAVPSTPQQYYASADCGQTIVHGATTRFDTNGAPTTAPGLGGLGITVLPVDVAFTRGQIGGFPAPITAYAATGSDTVGIVVNDVASDACSDGIPLGGTIAVTEPIAVALQNTELGTELWVQTREPSTLVHYHLEEYGGLTWVSTINLSGARRADSGHALYHRNPDGFAMISCASCHPEGRDDGHIWQFSDIGARRTQSLEGNVLETAPFHWDGDLDGMENLMTTVFQGRMGGIEQSQDRVDALADWLSENPRIGKPSTGRRDVEDPAAVARGKALFEDATVGCATCHSGELYTNNLNADVGTGGAVQVPSLRGVANRAPYMHDGCAQTLDARFDKACGGDKHGDVSGLDEQGLADLVAYMTSL